MHATSCFGDHSDIARMLSLALQKLSYKEKDTSKEHVPSTNLQLMQQKGDTSIHIKITCLLLVFSPHATCWQSLHPFAMITYLVFCPINTTCFFK